MGNLDSINDLIAVKSFHEAKQELEKYISDGHEKDIEAIKLTL